MAARFSSSLAEIGLDRLPIDRDARQYHGGGAHIVLCIAAASTERMQLQQFAGEVLVESLVAFHAGGRIGAERLRLIEIDQHRRMLGRAAQQIRKRSADMGPDRLGLEQGDDEFHRLGLVDTHREMICPEAGKPLVEAVRREDRLRDARIGIAPVALLKFLEDCFLFIALGVVVNVAGTDVAKTVGDIADRLAARIDAADWKETVAVAHSHRVEQRIPCRPAGFHRDGSRSRTAVLPWWSETKGSSLVTASPISNRLAGNCVRNVQKLWLFPDMNNL